MQHNFLCWSQRNNNYYRVISELQRVVYDFEKSVRFIMRLLRRSFGENKVHPQYPA